MRNFITSDTIKEIKPKTMRWVGAHIANKKVKKCIGPTEF
jgi:hypothetical protein